MNELVQDDLIDEYINWVQIRKPTNTPDLFNIILKNQESIRAIREWIEVMSGEPEGWIRMTEVYHSIRRMTGDE